MVKGVEAAGLPVVHMCTVTPISMTVGANRIVPTIAIPHPLGNPALEKEEEYKLRRELVEKALVALSDRSRRSDNFSNNSTRKKGEQRYEQKFYDVVILGAGPAGLAAGLYAGRARMSVLIVEKVKTVDRLLLQMRLKTILDRLLRVKVAHL